MTTRSLFSRVAITLLLTLGMAMGSVDLDLQALGNSLGGWKKRNSMAEYELSGATYRTFRPEVSPTPDGGLYISIRIDHVRGWLASNDHAVLEITVGKDGGVTSAKSSIAIQGRAITSDLIRGGTEAGQQLTTADRSVKIGTDLVADLSAKLLRERIVESGRVTFPAALRHNYNMLFQSIRVGKPDAAEAAPVEEERPNTANLDINEYATPKAAELPVEKKD
ncbi:MAG: hypothetical protein ACNA8L_02530 [Luteolibacter sp.]|jgi:hypothetical protein